MPAQFRIESRFISDSYYMERTPAVTPGNGFPLTNSYFELVNMEGLDAQFLSEETIKTINKWGRTSNNLNIDERTLTATLRIRPGHTRESIEYMENYYVPGTSFNMCYERIHEWHLVGVQNWRRETITMTMPVVISSVKYSRWGQDQDIVVNMTCLEPWFTEVDSSSLGSSVYTSLPASWVYDDTLHIASTASGKLTIDIITTALDTNDSKTFHITTNVLPEPADLSLHLMGDDILNSTLAGTRLIELVDWGNPDLLLPDESLYLAKGTRLDIAVKVGDQKINTSDQLKVYARYISAYPGLGNTAIIENLKPENLRKGVMIQGVTGTYTPDEVEVYQGPYFVTPRIYEQYITEMTDKEMSEDYVILPISAESDQNVKPWNIKKGISILGVVGTYDPGNPTPVMMTQPLIASPAPIAEPVTTQGNPLRPENIRYGINVNGVVGAYGNYPEYQGPKDITPTFTKQVLPTKYTTMLKAPITVEAVDTELVKKYEPNLKPENIKKGIPLFGVTGTY